LGWTALAKLASVLVTLRRPAGSGAEARPRRTRTAESSWPGKLSKASPRWPRRGPLADSAAAAGWLSPRFANRDFRSSIRSCRIEYPNWGAVQAPIAKIPKSDCVGQLFVVGGNSKHHSTLRRSFARPASPPAPLGSGGNVATAATAGVADGPEAEARALELQAVTRAEGALTRCFDLISKSCEMLNRGERSGG